MGFKAIQGHPKTTKKVNEKFKANSRPIQMGFKAIQGHPNTTQKTTLNIESECKQHERAFKADSNGIQDHSRLIQRSLRGQGNM